ncbi:ras-related protein Rsr1p [[Candida] railenensis]|uniref:Ras-related protein Rsr1p n=1 Tax=[Candida] railenensis TaxID=45579 RepID=A0A9P0QMP9_9ASCO|nr:ras-related protein Rsr1p [[Candida] railenensis]
MSYWRDGLHSLSNKYDICILGEDDSGKTSLVYSFVYEKFPDPFEATYENLYAKNVGYISEEEITEVTILDTSSVNDWSSHRNLQLQNAGSILLAYAINSRDSFEAMVDMYERISSLDIPISVVGLKSDLDIYRQVSTSEGFEFAASMDAIHFCECSSMVGTAKDAFKPLVQHLFIEKKKALQEVSNSSYQVSIPIIEQSLQDRALHDITEVDSSTEPVQTTSNNEIKKVEAANPVCHDSIKEYQQIDQIQTRGIEAPSKQRSIIPDGRSNTSPNNSKSESSCCIVT